MVHDTSTTPNPAIWQEPRVQRLGTADSSKAASQDSPYETGSYNDNLAPAS